jgi:hypothetical protein
MVLPPLATARGLSHVLDACGHFNPGVHAFFVHRERGCGKGRVGERTDGNDDAVFATLAGVVHRRSAPGAEVERALTAGITDPNKRVRSSGSGHRACGKSRLRSEDATRSALAGQAVADRDANRLGRCDSRELAARTAGSSGLHLEASVSRGQLGLTQHLRFAASSSLHASTANVMLWMLLKVFRWTAAGTCKIRQVNDGYPDGMLDKSSA